MKRKFLISLMSIVVVLVTCFFAYGESAAERKPAWILWKYESISTTERGKDSSSSWWKMVEAFPDYDQCREGMKKHWEKALGQEECFLMISIIARKNEEVPLEQMEEDFKKALRNLIAEPYEKISSLVLDPFRRYIIEFKCFPDTIDPRK